MGQGLRPCSGCGAGLPAERKALRCTPCNRQYQFEYRHSRKQSPFIRAKDRARQAVRYALGKGTLTRQPCELCGAETVEIHWRDMSRPLEVRWLCRAHRNE